MGRAPVVLLALLVAACGDSSAPNEDESPALGCGKSNPARGERTLSYAGFDGLYLVSLPASYDPNQRYPLGFAFHGSNRNHGDCRAQDCAGFQSAFGEEAVLVYLQSLREPNSAVEGGWDDAREDNVGFFEAVLEIARSEYCIDESRVFVAGASSGASFANLLACRFGDRLLATAPVSGALPESENCRGTPSAIVLHGIDDSHVPPAEGEAARDFFVARNGCSEVTEPELAAMHADIRAKRDAEPTVEDAACVEYQGCAAGSVRWCEHSYGGYDMSTHGWPPVGGQLIADFVRGLESL